MEPIQTVSQSPSEQFARTLRAELLSNAGVTRIPQCRRFTVLYSSGSPADSVFFLDSGIVKVVKRGPDNKEVLLTLVKAGEIFGEEALLVGGQRQACAEVVQEGSVYIIPKDLFGHFCNSKPEVWRMLAEMLAKREQGLEQKIELLLMRDVEQRILLYLADLAEVMGVAEQDGGHSLQFSQGEIASLVGATRETTSSTLNSLARRGLVSLGRRKMTIANPSTLREAAETPRLRVAAVG
ncbi:MAG: Crp/Fnr family transcriptional regulator [Acidobacteria bacterium]|nr:Crp/Fnr family transcriptional regulator [Acidobacteriota bacterium]